MCPGTDCANRLEQIRRIFEERSQGFSIPAIAVFTGVEAEDIQKIYNGETVSNDEELKKYVYHGLTVSL